MLTVSSPQTSASAPSAPNVTTAPTSVQGQKPPTPIQAVVRSPISTAQPANTQSVEPDKATVSQAADPKLAVVNNGQQNLEALQRMQAMQDTGANTAGVVAAQAVPQPAAKADGSAIERKSVVATGVVPRTGAAAIRTSGTTREEASTGARATAGQPQQAATAGTGGTTPAQSAAQTSPPSHSLAFAKAVAGADTSTPGTSEGVPGTGVGGDSNSAGNGQANSGNQGGFPQAPGQGAPAEPQPAASGNGTAAVSAVTVSDGNNGVVGKTTTTDPATAPIDRFQIADQVSRHLETMRLTSGQTEVSLNLTPDHLGSLRITLSTQPEGVVAHVVAESSHVQQAIEAGKQTLQSALESKGLTLQSLNVSVGQESANRNGAFSGQWQAPSSGQTSNRSQPAAVVSSTETNSLPNAEAGPRVRSGRLDYLV